MRSLANFEPLPLLLTLFLSSAAAYIAGLAAFVLGANLPETLQGALMLVWAGISSSLAASWTSDVSFRNRHDNTHFLIALATTEVGALGAFFVLRTLGLDPGGMPVPLHREVAFIVSVIGISVIATWSAWRFRIAAKNRGYLKRVAIGLGLGVLSLLTAIALASLTGEAQG